MSVTKETGANDERVRLRARKYTRESVVFPQDSGSDVCSCAVCVCVSVRCDVDNHVHERAHGRSYGSG